MRTAKLGPLQARLTGGPDRSGGGDGPVVVLLHGFGAPGDDLVPLARLVRPSADVRFVLPAAPIDLGPDYGGGRAWWPVDLEARMRRDALGLPRDIAEVPDGLEAARVAMDEFMVDLLGVLAPPRLVLGGFSQGAMLALDTALRSTRPLAGLVLLSGTHIAARQWAERLEARRGLAVFMSHGHADELLPLAVSEGLRDTLTAHGLEVQWVPFPGGHAIPGDVVDGVRGFLGRVLGTT